jgi:glycosyltransferase involved in cell wall biosynthesis
MSSNCEVFVNMRSQTAGLRGVQRYTAEVQRRLADRLMAVAPTKPMQGIKGHLWEQIALPRIVGNGLLWSPANTGPLSVANQVLTIHDIGSVEHPEWYNPLFAFWYRWLTPELIKRVRCVITVSSFSKERLQILVNPDKSKIVVIPEGVDARFCPRSADEIARMRTALGLPSPHYVLSLGALEPRKNLRRLLTAWSSCVSRLPEEVWLVLVGAGAPGNVFKTLDLGEIPRHVHVAGYVSDDCLPALYSGALALAYVSIYEGFGLPALEAMASGTVPVIADNTSLPEVVGEAGIAVDPYNVEQIAFAIERVIEDSEFRKTLELRATRRSQQFTWERTSDRTWEVLRETLAS